MVNTNDSGYRRQVLSAWLTRSLGMPPEMVEDATTKLLPYYDILMNRERAAAFEYEVDTNRPVLRVRLRMSE